MKSFGVGKAAHNSNEIGRNQKAIGTEQNEIETKSERNSIEIKIFFLQKVKVPIIGHICRYNIDITKGDAAAAKNPKQNL